MKTFIVRIELHDSHNHYDKLHKSMELAGFSRLIQGKDKVWYHLPTSEYYIYGENLNDVAISHKAYKCAEAITSNFDLLMTEGIVNIVKLRPVEPKKQ